MKHKLHLFTICLLCLLHPAIKAQSSLQSSDFTLITKYETYNFQHNNHSYQLVKSQQSWQEAAKIAVEHGGYLVEINDANEQQAIWNAIVAANINMNYNNIPSAGGVSYVYIGATDHRQENRWHWDGDDDGNGSFLGNNALFGPAQDGAYQNWGSDPGGMQNEPDDAGDQDFAAIGLNDWPLGFAGQWNDIAFFNQCYFIVEYNKASSEQSIKASSITPVTYGATPFQLNWTASSGLPITYSSDDHTVATVNGTTITIVGAGECFITATQTGNDEWAAAEPVKKLLYASPKNLAATSDPITKVYDGSNFIRLNIDLHGIIEGDEVSLLDNKGTLESINVGENIKATFDNTLTGTDAHNYNLSTNEWYVNITPKTLTVENFNIAFKSYDGTTTATTFGTETIAGFVNGDQTFFTGFTCEHSTKNAGQDMPVTVAPQWKEGSTVANNYVFSGIENKTGSIFERAVGLPAEVAKAKEKVYDGTTTAELTETYALNNVIEGENVSYTVDLEFKDKNAGVDKPVKMKSAQLTGPDAGNYTMVLMDLTGDITPKQLVLPTITVQDKQYDGQISCDHNFNINTITSQILPADRTFISINWSFNHKDKNVGTDKPIDAIMQLQGTSSDNYFIEVPEYTASITPRALTINNASVYNKTYDGTTEATLATNPVLSGVVPGDDVVLTQPEYQFPSKNAGSYDNVMATECIITGADINNYIKPESPVISGTINRKNISVQPIFQHRVYDGTKTISTDKWDIKGVLPGDDIYINEAQFSFENADAGENKAITMVSVDAGGADTDNYFSDELNNYTATIHKKDLMITANSYERNTGDENPVFEFTYEGFVNGEDETVLDNEPQATCIATKDSPAGDYTITASCDADNNYNVICYDGTLTVKVSTGLDNNNTTSLSLYPNPCYNHLKLKTDVAGLAKVVNLAGQVQLQQSCQGGTNDINVEKLKPGVYILQFGTNSQKVTTLKFIKK